MRAQAPDEVSQISADRPDRAYSLGEEQRPGGRERRPAQMSQGPGRYPATDPSDGA
jgi:hypothetical protein